MTKSKVRTVADKAFDDDMDDLFISAVSFACMAAIGMVLAGMFLMLVG